jgi:hypothetical protein
MKVARRFIAGVRDPMACVPEGTPEFGALGGIFHLDLSGTPDWLQPRSNFKPSGVPPGRRSYG